jgi:hypothetical protein
LVTYLIDNGADVNYRNYADLSSLDCAIVHGNYQIAYYLKLKNLVLAQKSAEDYIHLNKELNLPLFNIPLFMEHLTTLTDPKDVPIFALTREQVKDFENYVPDPNESWGNFFKRIGKFELYKPPMVKKDSFPEEKKDTLYMKVQKSLLQFEYGKASNLNDLICSCSKGC